jgi:hypothetical protein
MGGRPSWLRPLAIACSVAATQLSESSYFDPEQLWRKLGCGAMFAASAPAAVTGVMGGAMDVGGAGGIVGVVPEVSWVLGGLAGRVVEGVSPADAAWCAVPPVRLPDVA